VAYAYAVVGCLAKKQKWNDMGAYRKPSTPLRTKDNAHMPLLVFDRKGIPATRRERIQAAVEAGGRHVISYQPPGTAVSQRCEADFGIFVAIVHGVGHIADRSVLRLTVSGCIVTNLRLSWLDHPVRSDNIVDVFLAIGTRRRATWCPTATRRYADPSAGRGLSLHLSQERRQVSHRLVEFLRLIQSSSQISRELASIRGRRWRRGHIRT
jgi:hypothetical protein